MRLSYGRYSWMKQLFLWSIVAFSCLSCEEISFRDPQPRGKKHLLKVPDELHGRYLAESQEEGLSKDTIIITASGYKFGYYNPADRMNEISDGASVGDSVILKYFKGHYFLNVNENPEWLLRVVKRESNGDLRYFQPSSDNLSFESYLKRLGKEIPIDSFSVNGEKLYQINPSPNQLLQLIRKGYFSETLLKRID